MREPLSRERIVTAALASIEANGLANLTMRRLGDELNVEAMSLYRYVPGREALLDAVVTRVIAEMQADADVIESPRDGWQDFLQRLAHGVRRVALAYPVTFPLVASRPVEAPWLRPPLRSLATVERFLDGLLAEGFSDENAVGAYRAFSSFLLGHLLLEVANHGAALSVLDALGDPAPSAGTGPDSAGDYPTVGRLRDALSEDHAVVEFEDALEQLLQRLELMHANASDR